MSTNNDKQNQKQLTTAIEVSDVAVWDKHNKEMRRISKVAFDADVASKPILITDQITPRTSGGDIKVGSMVGTSKIVTEASTEGIGYTTGAGGAVTQITTIATAVALNTMCGTITTVSSTLAAGADASFRLTNSNLAATDTIIIHTASYGGTADGIPITNIENIGSGFANINIRNTGAVTLDALITIRFSIIKSVNA
mgnify:CR=1 FL=1